MRPTLVAYAVEVYTGRRKSAGDGHTPITSVVKHVSPSFPRTRPPKTAAAARYGGKLSAAARLTFPPFGMPDGQPIAAVSAKPRATEAKPPCSKRPKLIACSRPTADGRKSAGVCPCTPTSLEALTSCLLRRNATTPRRRQPKPTPSVRTTADRAGIHRACRF